MKIAIFEGKFNPISKSHILIAEDAIKSLNLDKFVFVPCYKPLFNSKERLESPENRSKMISLSLGDKMEMSNFAIARKAPTHMSEIISYFKKQFPSAKFYIIIGSDSVSKLSKWKDIETLSSVNQIVVYKRDNNFSKEVVKRFNGIVVKDKTFSFSSSEFRKGQMHNVTKPVIDYIAENYLYVPELMASMLDAKRHKHSLAVAALAAEYAKLVGVDAKKAYFAGAMHDITKWWPKEAHREFLTYIGLNELEFEDYELHATTGYYWLKTQYQLKDEEIMQAILKHTSLASELSMLDKIIFAADKLAEGRKFEGIQEIRKLILSDFEKGFKAIVAKTYEQLLEARDLTEETKRIMKGWM